MKFKKRGKNISPAVEITHCSPHGFWMLIHDREFFLDFESYPWFEIAPLKDLMEVSIVHEKFLRWESLDIDLEIDSLIYPEHYPLISKFYDSPSHIS